MTGPNDPDTYYKQPGHPLSPDSERFRVSAMNDVACIQRSPVRCVRRRATCPRLPNDRTSTRFSDFMYIFTYPTRVPASPFLGTERIISCCATRNTSEASPGNRALEHAASLLRKFMAKLNCVSCYEQQRRYSH
jgi:hypothetical protein